MTFSDLKERLHIGKRAPGSTKDDSDRGSASWRTADWWRPRKRYEVADRPADSDALHGRLPAIVLEYSHLSGRHSLLAETILSSLQAFGFFTGTAIRYLEYPWVVENIIRAPAPGAVLDVGAGVSPVPLRLASRGWKVTTIDFSQTTRSLSQSGRMNEWGYLDYQEADQRIQSLNEDFSQADFAPGSFDVIYSVSVIEHMPAAIRRDVISAASRYLKTGGRLVLTLDLEPGSLQLWNRNLGKVVEEPKAHGTLDHVLRELRRVGFDTDHFEMHRNLPKSNTDVVFLSASKL